MGNSGECVLFSGVSRGRLIDRAEPEDGSTTSYSFRVTMKPMITVHKVLRECATTTTSISTSTASTTATTTATTASTTCKTAVTQTLSAVPDGYEILHLGNFDPDSLRALPSAREVAARAAQLVATLSMMLER